MIPWWQAILPVAVPVVAYIAFLGLLAIPAIQRFALYSHRASTLLFTNLDEPERWGFAKNQVTPFLLKTSDGETLYAWHVLPLRDYGLHEAELLKRPRGRVEDFTKTEACRILREDPEARVVVSFHGNAGHIAQGWRPTHYHAISSSSTAAHLLTIDYRGFGHSTGSPTESGLVADATALLDLVLSSLAIPPSRITIIGHSLGTAVASAMTAKYASSQDGGVDFSSVVLVAPFSSLPNMLSGYRVAGWVPVLRPLAALCPPLSRFFLARFVVDRWDSAARVAEAVRAVKARPGGRLRLRLVHAVDDWDIPCREDDALFAAAVRAALDGEEGKGEGKGLDDRALMKTKDDGTVWKGERAFAARWTHGGVDVRQELVSHGGHNEVLTHAAVALAVLETTEGVGADVVEGAGR